VQRQTGRDAVAGPGNTQLDQRGGEVLACGRGGNTYGEESVFGKVEFSTYVPPTFHLRSTSSPSREDGKWSNSKDTTLLSCFSFIFSMKWKVEPRWISKVENSTFETESVPR